MNRLFEFKGASVATGSGLMRMIWEVWGTVRSSGRVLGYMTDCVVFALPLMAQDNSINPKPNSQAAGKAIAFSAVSAIWFEPDTEKLATLLSCNFRTRVRET